MSPNLTGKICLVTGASRGIGKGIALQLGQAGATVYITGRTKVDLDACCREIKERGGNGIPIVVDHSKDEEVQKLFEKIGSDQNGQLDVLVNNAYAAVNFISDNVGKSFWESPPSLAWDITNNVGLRNHYICTVHAARMMVPRKSGLIIYVSSGGGLKYLFNVPYGVGKAAVDRMAADCGFELRKHNVAVVSLWPGPVKTENIKTMFIEHGDAPDAMKSMFIDHGESQEFSGKAVAHLAADTAIMGKSGRIQMTADLAREYGFTDEDGKINGDMRQIKFMLEAAGWTRLATVCPGFLRLPLFLMHFGSYKF